MMHLYLTVTCKDILVMVLILVVMDDALVRKKKLYGMAKWQITS